MFAPGSPHLKAKHCQSDIVFDIRKQLQAVDALKIAYSVKDISINVED